MNQKVLQWATLDSKQWPGAFREKDLDLLFRECCDKYRKLTELTKQKQELSAKYVAKQSQNSQPAGGRQIPRQSTDTSKKKSSEPRFKCGVKGCGKIMNSQSALAIHSRKHYDKKGRKVEHFQGSQEQGLDQ